MAGWRYDAKNRSTGDGECGYVDAPDIESAVEKAQEKSKNAYEVYIVARVNEPGI